MHPCAPDWKKKRERNNDQKNSIGGLFINRYYKNKLPDWLDTEKDLSLVLTNDVDSWLSCAILESIKGWKIDAFMDFRFLKKPNDRYYIRQGADLSSKETAAIDYDIVRGKCIGNHITRFSDKDRINPEAINIHNVCNVTRRNYSKKCVLSTVLLLWAYFDLPIDNLSEEMKMFLLAIDGAYSGYFAYDGKYRQHIERYLIEIFDMPELYRCLERHTEQDFRDIIDKYKIAGEDDKHRDYKIHVSMFNQKLYTYMNYPAINRLLEDNGLDFRLQFPNEPFIFKYEYKDMYEKISNDTEISLNDERIISVVLVDYRNCVYSIRKKEEGIA